MPLALLALVLLLCPGLHAAQAKAPSLDGTTLAVAFSDSAGKAMGEDSIVFADGKLDLPGIRAQFGFEAAACTVTAGKDGALAFTATLTSVKHGSLLVEGSLAKAKASGKRSWSKPGKEPIVHTFTGAPKAKP